MLLAKKLRKLTNLAADIRKDVLAISTRANTSHIASALSPVELLVTLYFHRMRLNPKNPQWKLRDRFILSKGHGGAALFATLMHRGFFPRRLLETFCLDGSLLTTHPMRKSAPGIEATTGSLGHGLSIAIGMALAAQHEKRKNFVYAILSDGECDEGSVWEGALFAGHHKIDNLIIFIDYNKNQGIGRTSEILDLEPFADKFRSFRWDVEEIDGHDMEAIDRAIENAQKEPGFPHCIIAHTIKGRGVSYMEDQNEWHYRVPKDKHLDQALRELAIQKEL